MHEVLLYSETLRPETVREALSRLEVKAVANRVQLAERIVKDTDVLCVIIQLERLDDPWRRLLGSVTRSFPLLNVGLMFGVLWLVTRLPFGTRL